MGWQKCRPVAPTALTRGGEITLAVSSHWRPDKTATLVHYMQGENAVVVSYPVGQGEVIWWADKTPLTNAGVRESGNLELLLNSVGDPHRRVLWDEYFHGAERSLWASMADTPLRWALVQLGIFAIALLLTFSRRSGPLRPLVEESRLSPLEFVRTLGGLYQSAHAAPVVVEAAYQRFRVLLTRRLGLQPTISAAEMARTAQQRLGFSEPGFAETLQRCEGATADPALHDAQAVQLTQLLNHYSRKLGLIPGSQQEND